MKIINKGVERVLGVYIDEMASNELRDEMTVTLYKGDEAVSAAYKFSPESVLKGMLASKTELITAIMNYGDAAIDFPNAETRTIVFNYQHRNRFVRLIFVTMRHFVLRTEIKTEKDLQ